MVGLRDSGELESDEPLEEFSPSSPPWDPTNFPYFPPSPTFFPVWGPVSFPPSPPSLPLYLQASPPSSSSTPRFLVARSGFALKYVPRNQQHEDVIDAPVIRLVVFVDYKIGDRGSGELYVVNGLEGGEVINELDLGDLSKLLNDALALAGKVNELTTGTVNELEHQHEDIVDQHQIIDFVEGYICGIENRGGKLDFISVRRAAYTLNGAEFGRDQALDSTTPEPSLVFEVKLSLRVWLGHRGQWVADIRYGWNWLNIGTFKTATLASESATRLRGGKDLFDFPRFFVIEKYASEPLQLQRQTAQVENQDDGIGCVGTGDCAMADQAQFNSGGLEKTKAREKNPGLERRNKKANGVRIAIPLEDILQTKGMRLIDAAKHLEVSKSTLKRVCREYDIYRWPPRKEQELIGQSRPNKSPAVVNQEQIPQLNPDTLLSSNLVPAISDTYSVKVKVRCEEGTIMFRLSCPWRKVELEQGVKERLSFEAGTYKIEYKDEDDELILINCDKDLEECISSSSAEGSRWIELFLKLK